MKYFNPMNYYNQALRFSNHYLLHRLDCITAPPYENTFKHPPIFLLGAPRSGSTLIFQVITDAFDVAYLSNRHCQFFGTPALAERLFHPTRRRPPSEYRSNHGVTRGAYAPSECGEWWYRFFRRNPAYVTLKDVDEAKMRCFRRSLLAFTEVADKPVVFKNLYASLRLEPINRHIPEALYIIISRNELDNGHSLLETRKRIFGNYYEWWSIPPSNVEELKKLPAYAQVIEQIRSINNTIDIEIKAERITSSKVHRINYEQFCDDVHREINLLRIFLKKNNCIVKIRGNSIPSHFTRRAVVRIDKDIYEQMNIYVRS